MHRSKQYRSAVERIASGRSDAGLPRLNRRARDRAVGAEDTAIPRLRPEAVPTTLAVIKELAGVLGHAFGCLMPAFGTGDGRIRDHVNLIAAPSRHRFAASAQAQRPQVRWMPRTRELGRNQA